jgi:hypothetical protein
MPRGRVNLVVTVLVALALALPIAARSEGPKNSKSTVNTTMDLLNAATIAGKQLKPGMYQVKVDETKLTLEHNGKLVAEASVQWKESQNKPAYSSIVVENNQITEIHFGGKTRYIEVSPDTSPAANGGER